MLVSNVLASHSAWSAGVGGGKVAVVAEGLEHGAQSTSGDFVGLPGLRDEHLGLVGRGHSRPLQSHLDRVARGLVLGQAWRARRAAVAEGGVGVVGIRPAHPAVDGHTDEAQIALESVAEPRRQVGGVAGQGGEDALGEGVGIALRGERRVEVAVVAATEGLRESTSFVLGDVRRGVGGRPEHESPQVVLAQRNDACIDVCVKAGLAVHARQELSARALGGSAASQRCVWAPVHPVQFEACKSVVVSWHQLDLVAYEREHGLDVAFGDQGSAALLQVVRAGAERVAQALHGAEPVGIAACVGDIEGVGGIERVEYVGGVDGVEPRVGGVDACVCWCARAIPAARGRGGCAEQLEEAASCRRVSQRGGEPPDRGVVRIRHR